MPAANIAYDVASAARMCSPLPFRRFTVARQPRAWYAAQRAVSVGVFVLRPKRDHDVDVLRVEVSDIRPTRPASSESMAEGPARP
ncbi:hypothetical protein [Streptomyces europaeiscabiei]|uniref:hypothetical protein n=1 Tax=Streptomyces europaeiscabiei TaxID=146819 RepID=UPI002E2E1305|nr:hypothetical protein [Streptomyces europaeiscabiei]